MFSKISFSHFILCFICLLPAADFARAQGTAASPSPAVTAAATAERVRFTAPSTVQQMRLEVYNAAGLKLFDNEVRGGNVLDWRLQDGQAEPLADGAYLCLVTVKYLSGHLSQKLGALRIEQGQATLQPAEAGQMSAQQAQAIGPVEAQASLTVLDAAERQTTTVIAHTGSEGQVIRGSGALSFRLGDFYRGQDQEQMRLTAEGKLGLGVAEPQAKLDVDGLIRTNEGIVFPDGSVQTTAYVASGRSLSERAGLQRDSQGRSLAEPGTKGSEVALRSPTFSITGAGNAGKLTKWTGSNGNASSDVGDSVVTELSGNIGINNPSPSTQLHVGGFAGYGATTGLLLGNNLLGSMFDRALQVAPVQTASPGFNSILLYTLPTVNAGVTVPRQYGFFIDGKQGAGAVTSYAALATGQFPSLGASNNTHLLMGQLSIPPGNYAVYEATGYKSYFSGKVGIGTINPLAQLEIQTNNPAAEALFAQHTSVNGVGLSGVANMGGSSMGVSGRSIEGYGVQGSSARSTGVDGTSTDGDGVHGTSSNNYGVHGSSTALAGVRGFSGSSYGVYGTSGSTNLAGVYGTGFIGVEGLGGLYGLRGVGDIGVWGRGNALSGVLGISSNGTGVHGQGESGTGVRGDALATTGTNPGVYGLTNSTDPAGDGVFGFSSAGRGVQGNSDSGSGVFGYSGTGYAGYFQGNVYVTGSLTQFSDARLKRDVIKLSYGLREVMLLRPVSWAWKEKSDGAVNLGLIAQEVEPLIPELVSTGTDAEQTKGLNYIGLIPVLVKGVQEQQTQIEGQQKRITQQQEQIKQQQSQIKQAESQIDSLKKLVCLDHPNAEVCQTAGRKP